MYDSQARGHAIWRYIQSSHLLCLPKLRGIPNHPLTSILLTSLGPPLYTALQDHALHVRVAAIRNVVSEPACHSRATAATRAFMGHPSVIPGCFLDGEAKVRSLTTVAYHFAYFCCLEEVVQRGNGRVDGLSWEVDCAADGTALISRISKTSFPVRVFCSSFSICTGTMCV
jgi:hypothetical protein